MPRFRSDVFVPWSHQPYIHSKCPNSHPSSLTSFTQNPDLELGQRWRWLEAEGPVAEITPPFPSHVLFENAKELSRPWVYKQGIANTDQITSISHPLPSPHQSSSSTRMTSPISSCAGTVSKGQYQQRFTQQLHPYAPEPGYETSTSTIPTKRGKAGRIYVLSRTIYLWEGFSAL